MSQRSKVSLIALWRYSLNVIVFVFVFAFVFVVVFLLVRSCFFMTPISFARFWFGLEGFESNTRTKQSVIDDQGRPRAARAAKNYKYSHFKKSQLFSDIIMFYFLSLPNPTSSHQLQIMAATNMECNNNIGKQIRWKNVRKCVFWQLSNIQFIETDLHF